MRVALLLGAFVAVYIGFWMSWKSGTVITESQANGLASKVIKVRQIPTSAPLWGLFARSLFTENPYYRCEYYAFGSAPIYSCQTYHGESYNAQTANVRWDQAGGATIFLDQVPVFTCDARGFWKETK